MSATGTATIDFGAFPGSNEAVVTVTGQAGVGTGSNVEAFMMGDTTSDHTVNDHYYAALLMRISCGNIIAGTGFDIVARSEYHMQGTFQIRWVWA
jgi:hypothetical protein